MSATNPNSVGQKPERSRFQEYLESLRYEFRKISWPEKKQWIQSTTVVFIFAVVLMLVLWTLDIIVAFLFRQIM
jgi:preprotein translocase SecE subunit